MTKTTTYDTYRDLVDKARLHGYNEAEIVAELRKEIVDIWKKRRLKVTQLAMEKSPYKIREASRLASECVAVIERIILDLEKKESHV